jgi:hypothetical protein
MIARVSMILLALSASALLGASTRSDLIFEINAALKGHDRREIEQCFDFRGVSDATRQGVDKMIGQMLSWPAFYVFTSERKEEGAMHIESNGQGFTLNGDWKFQVHIFRAKPPSGGFVFPAGFDDGKCLLLLTVPEKSE